MKTAIDTIKLWISPDSPAGPVFGGALAGLLLIAFIAAVAPPFAWLALRWWNRWLK